MKTREKLINANKYCHIYTDDDGVTCIHNTESNETYRVIPDVSMFGFYIEYHKDAKLVARNSVGFGEMKTLALLAGSNHLLRNLNGGEAIASCHICGKTGDDIFYSPEDFYPYCNEHRPNEKD